MGYRKLTLLGLTTIFLLIGCQEEVNNQIDAQTEVDIESISIEKQEEQRRTYTYEDYKVIFDRAVVESEKFKENDELLKKWLIRILAEEQLLYKTDLTEKQVLQVARQRMHESEMWKDFAKDQYGISFTEEELDQFITEGPEKDLLSNSEDLDESSRIQYQAYSVALGLTLKDLIRQFDRDLHERNVIWLKLRPKLEKKYEIGDNNRLLEKFQEEITEKSLKK